MTVPLSVVVITKNEESRLKECLDSVVWAGEIVVVDDESTDRTLEIARRYTDRILQRKMDIEGRHRNFAYAQARYAWVFSLDADERVTPELRDEITALLRGEPPCAGYTVPRRNFIGSRWVRHGGWYPSPQLKLFRKDRFRYEESEVHPRVFMDGDCGQLTGDLIHYSYRNIEDFVAKLNRQTTLEARKWIRDGRKMSVGRALWRTVDRFCRTWWTGQGHRDGDLGFAVAVFAGFYQFLSFAKYWHAKSLATGPVGETAGGGRGAGPDAARSSRAPIHLGWFRERGESCPSTATDRSPLPPPAPARPPDVPSRPPAPARLTLSAVVLTKNEAGQIRNCLERIQWVDEIIVVDGESTDNTPQICSALGARVVSHRFEGDFGEERNIGNAHATKDWILQLDADDRVTEEFRIAAEQILRKGTRHAAYKFRRRNCFLGHWMKHGGWYHYSLHFFRRGKAFYRGRVHHDLLVDGSMGTLEAAVEHHPFSSLEQFWDRQNRYTTLEAQELLEKQGAGSERERRYQIRIRPAKLFWKMMVKKQGYREGMIGLIFSGLYSFVHFLKWAKLQEMIQNKEGS